MTLLEMLRGQPGAPAVIVPGGPAVTYASLSRQVERLAGQFAALGAGPGDRVALALPNGIEVIVALLAAAMAGTAAPMNPHYKREEFRFYLNDTGAKMLLVPRGGGAEARQAAGEGVMVAELETDASGEVRVPGAG
ncbi:MAG: AMP-binding protein, partial [Acidobacteria bacterium]|nr:AMP-binding protein [Acidobacteriota bacterium]